MSPVLITSLVFLFLIGSCVGSFLNVVVHRLPLGLSLVNPPSRCPKCERRLAWYDNIPVLGWIKLGGKCRWCHQPISPRYPIFEALTGLLFVAYAVAVFVFGYGPCVAHGGPIVSDVGLPLPAPLANVANDWPLLAIHLFLIAALLAASLIDIETFTIPDVIPLSVAVFSIACHGLLMLPRTPGSLYVGPVLALAAAGATAGYLLSLLLLRLKVLRRSFPTGEPMMLDRAQWQAEIDAAASEGREPNVPKDPPIHWTRGMLNEEMAKEIAFIFFPVAGFVLGLFFAHRTSAGHDLSAAIAGWPMVPGMLGAVLGGLAGGASIWCVRIGGTLGFGKVAMGLGDIYLMAAVGCAVGGSLASLAIFPAAIFGLAFTLYAYFARATREVPFGPYLAAGTVTLMLLACPVMSELQDIWSILTGG
jgi:leader peptidase (prepilin peptidase)/N-methyltransferase